MSDCELPEYYECKERVARKPHKCCECSAPIKIKEKHLVVSTCYEGRPGRYRQHALCQQACEFVRDQGINDDECLYFGGLQEFYGGWIKDGSSNSEPIEIRRTLWRMMLGINRRERKSPALLKDPGASK